MQRILPFGLLVICGAAYLGWTIAMNRSATIRLEPSGYELNYSMH